MRAILALAAAFALAAPAAEAQGPPDRPGQAQGQARGQDRRPEQAQARGQGQAQGQDRARGKAEAEARRGPPSHARARANRAPDPAAFNRDVVRRAVEVRSRRSGGSPRVELRREGEELRVVRSDGRLLFALDRSTADSIGYWRVAVAPTWERAAAAGPSPAERRGGIFEGRGGYDQRAEGGAPSFCQSDDGHPVWGREWCLDKGFGLGDGGTRWGRATGLDVVLRRPGTDRDELDRGGLIDVLGDVVFGRIALQSLVLGADEPLTGEWIGEEDGPRVLRIRAGDLHVAELVDADRDDRVDVLVVNLGG